MSRIPHIPIPFDPSRFDLELRLRSALRCSLILVLGLLVSSADAFAQACPGEGDPCDGPDSDHCLEGVITCAGSLPICDDVSGDDLDSCDGFDNDRNPATPDGSDEPNLNAPCDGGDIDLCLDGSIVCNNFGVLECYDPYNSHWEVCDGLDNDCNPTLRMA